MGCIPNGNTALIYATLYDSIETVHELIINGANINHLDNNGDSALTIANRFRSIQIVETLNYFPIFKNWITKNINSRIEEIYSILISSNIEKQKIEDKTIENEHVEEIYSTLMGSNVEKQKIESKNIKGRTSNNENDKEINEEMKILNLLDAHHKELEKEFKENNVSNENVK